MARSRRRPSRRTVLLVLLASAVVVLFSVLVPIHATLYGTALPIALLLGAALTSAPLVAIGYPRTSIVLIVVPAIVLPLVVSPDREPFWPWPWSVPALITFAIYIAVITFLHGWRRGLLPLVLGIVGSLAAPGLLPQAAATASVVADITVTASLTGAVYLVAVLFDARLRVGDELTREREVSAHEQSRRIVVEERTRIARELHDVVAHSLSLIQVQASTARYRVADIGDSASAEFDDIASNARQSLSEMRRLLGVLRTEDHLAELAPQQGINDIPALVFSIRRAGVSVDLEIIATAPGIPASVEIATYRIVQEALSNAVRHAPDTSIAVNVRTDADAVVLSVRNSPGMATAPASPGTGHGIRGMTERASLLAGSLDAGPDPDGGWTVAAVLPWAAQSSAAEGAP